MYLRRVTLADVAEVAAYAEGVLRALPDVPLHVSTAKVRGMVAQFAIERQHLGLVVVDAERIVGAIALWVAEMPFHERCEAHIVFCHASLPGAGTPMIRAAMDWVHRDMRIQRVQWCMNVGQDERLGRLLARRHGFVTKVDNLIFYKGA